MRAATPVDAICAGVAEDVAVGVDEPEGVAVLELVRVVGAAVPADATCAGVADDIAVGVGVREGVDVLLPLGVSDAAGPAALPTAVLANVTPVGAPGSACWRRSSRLGVLIVGSKADAGALAGSSTT